MSTYGFDCQGVDWTGEAGSLAEAIEIAEAETGRRVQRGRCLDNYTAPTAADYVDIRAFRRAMRAMDAEAARVARRRMENRR